MSVHEPPVPPSAVSCQGAVVFIAANAVQTRVVNKSLCSDGCCNRQLIFPIASVLPTMIILNKETGNWTEYDIFFLLLLQGNY